MDDSVAEFHKKVEQARFQESSSGMVFFETFIFAVVVGVWLHSWAVGVGVLVAFVLMQGFAIVLSTLFCLGWGVVGWWLGDLLGSWTTSIVGSAIFFLFAFGVHQSALAWSKDYETKSKLAGLKMDGDREDLI